MDGDPQYAAAKAPLREFLSFVAKLHPTADSLDSSVRRRPEVERAAFLLKIARRDDDETMMMLIHSDRGTYSIPSLHAIRKQ